MFNIMHCVQNGHELVALANLHPPVASSDEMDSFMYQTVGYHAVSLYDQCLGVPMYRAEIVGSSVVQSLEYSPSIDDETEDLFRLLRRVKKSHSIDAVSVGAILSTYQRTRVESVCQRLGLTCLAYLWNRSQAELLDEIIDSGVDARIVKTAGVGLNKSHLGKSLADIRDELVQLNEKYGLHLCGEGGEYETLVLDSPFMKKRLVLDIENSKVIEDSDDCVSYLCDLAVTVEEKDNYDSNALVRVPPAIDEQFEELYADLKGMPAANGKNTVSADALGSQSTIPEMQVSKDQNRVFIANVTSPAQSLELETKAVFDILVKELENEGLCMDNILSISLLVADMTQFQEINAIYGQYFEKPNPPSRLCIQTNLPCRLQLSALATRDTSTRTGLHVQGRSYWAPANIGPYAQSIQSQEVTTIAGQIGLIPSTLELAPDVIEQTVLSFQHITRVKETVNSPQFSYAVAFVVSSTWVPLVSSAWESGTLLIAVVRALPKGAQVEWTGQAINEMYIKMIPDDDEDDDDSPWVYPARPVENGVEYGRYGTKTLIGTPQQIESQILNIKNVFATTIYTSEPQILEFNCEVIYVDALYDRNGNKVQMGAVVTYRL